MTSSNGNSTTLTTVRPDIFQIFLQDEDGQNILSIDDGALRQSLRIEIVNTSGQNIEFRSVDNQPSLNNYHFCISFRPGTLLLSQDEDQQISLKETDEGWQMQQQDQTFYLSLNNADSRVIKNGERITLTLENIGAAPSGGSRGTRVEIKYDRLQYQGSNETISGNRLQYLNIVNQRGKKQVPLYVGFLGSNTILNDGTENKLTLTIQSLPNQSAALTLLESSTIEVTNDSTSTRWQGDIFKFLTDKFSDFATVIQELEKKQNLNQGVKVFLGKVNSFINQNSLEKSNSFELLKQEVDNLSLKDSDKNEITQIVIDSLGIVSQDDLNSIATKLGELLSFGVTNIQEIIQQSTSLQVIKSELNQNGALEFKGLDNESTFDQAVKFTISFDVATTETDSKNWALVEKTDADNIHIIMEQGQKHWVFGGKEEQGITPRWNFICKQGWSLQKENREEILRIKISNLKTELLSGYANLYVHFENIPGYWDGYVTVPIHKGPLVYREKTSGNNKVGCVGIGTDKPQAKLHIKPPSGVDGLKVEGNTAIAGNLSVTNTNQDANGNTLILGPTNQSNLRMGYHQNYSWIQSHGSKPLAINPIGNNVGIGTSNPGSNKLKVEGNTAIAGNLTVNGSISGDINANKITSGVLNADRIPKSLSLSNLELKTNKNRLRMFLYDDAVVLFLDKGRGKNNAQIAWRGEQWTVLSDIRFKTEIENENKILSRLMKLNVKNYRWKDDCEDQAKTIGFIAQDVQPLFPTLVDVWKDKDGYEEKLSLQYSQFGVLAVGGLKELKQEKDSEIAEMRKEFDEKIKELQTEINKLKNR